MASPPRTQPEVLSIPVFVDAERQIENEEMARCVYFVISIDEPSPGWTVDLANRRIPFLMIGLSGIIYRPDPDTPFFEDAESIDRIYRAVEDSPALSIEVEDLWLPSGILREKAPRNRLERNAVFRIGVALFSAAYRFRDQRTTLGYFAAFARDQARNVEYSPVEAAAFGAWNARQIENSRTNYREHEFQALRYEE